MAGRFAIWIGAAAVAWLADVLTKAAPHSIEVHHYAHTPVLALLAISGFLCSLALWGTQLRALGAGLMFGGLCCGNGAQVLLHGYASDWIPIAGWLTNLGDIAGAAGLVCCLASYAVRR